MSGIDGRMLDKNAYSTETLNTFSFISAYFVDLLYNHLYTQAIRFHRNQQVATITDGYKASLDAYLQQINSYNKELYSDLVHGIHKSFIDYGFIGITYQSCIDKIVKEFIPQDYWRVISFDDKSKILGTIITNSSRAIVHKIISTHLSNIIDNHADPENANILQDDFIEILIMEREKLYHEFISAKTNKSGGGDSSLFQAMEKEILELSKQKNELRQQNHDIKKEMLEMQKKLLAICKHTKSLVQKVKDLELELDQSKLASAAELSALRESVSIRNTQSIDPESEYSNNEERLPSRLSANSESRFVSNIEQSHTTTYGERQTPSNIDSQTYGGQYASSNNAQMTNAQDVTYSEHDPSQDGDSEEDWENDEEVESNQLYKSQHISQINLDDDDDDDLLLL